MIRVTGESDVRPSETAAVPSKAAAAGVDRRGLHYAIHVVDEIPQHECWTRPACFQVRPDAHFNTYSASRHGAGLRLAVGVTPAATTIIVAAQGFATLAYPR
jgi:hypothetical protein